MSNKANAILQDSGIERAILAGIITHGADCFFDVEEILGINDFYWKYNQELFKIITHLVHQEDTKTFDLPSIQAVAKILGYKNFVSGGKYAEYLEAVVDEIGSSKENIISLVVVVYKLSIARRGYLTAVDIQKNLEIITGAEKVDDIISSVEEPVFEFTGDITSRSASLTPIGQRCDQILETLLESDQDMVGLPTGFSEWDAAIGGGLRPATVNVVGARPKLGKSFFCMNVAKNLAENTIPVLYLDTELTYDTQLLRLWSLVSSVSLEHVETGKFKHSTHEKEALIVCKDNLRNLPITHLSVAGLAPQAIMSLARRWLSRTVGFTNSGAAKPCLIIYDYIKLMDEEGFKHGLQEYQLLGFLMTSLHNFAVKFNLPILATVQLNRDGVEKEGAEVVSGSDRVAWLCSNFSIFKKKTPKELNEDPPSNGTKKLVVTDTRYGAGQEPGEYINIVDNLSVGKLTEGPSFPQAIQQSFKNEIVKEK